MKDILDSLGLEGVNPGTWFGSEASKDTSAPLIESINPSTGEVIASVRNTTAADYERVIEMAQESFEIWRTLGVMSTG